MIHIYICGRCHEQIETTLLQTLVSEITRHHNIKNPERCKVLRGELVTV